MEVRVEVRMVGERAVLVEVGDVVAALDLASWLRERLAASGLRCEEVVPAARTVLLDGVEDVAEIRRLVRRWVPGSSPPAGELVELPVVYDGADLARVADRWGTDPAGVAELLGGLELVAAFSGFAPGFAYLAGLPEELAVPRLRSPRARVPAGSVAVADTWCGVYPSASPGGWSLVGHTDRVTWDATRPQPALLSPGTRVRFRTVGVRAP